MNNLQTFLKRNASTILTCFGAVGVAGTAALAVKATPEATRLCDEVRREKEEPTKLDYVKAAWKPYIPAVLVGVSTITCIFGANVLNKRQQAALASAYAFLDNAYKEYRKKVKELYGEDADTNVKRALILDKYEEEKNNYTFESDECLFYEFNHGEYFERTRAEVVSAEYRLNMKLERKGWAILNDFYDFLDLPRSEIGDRIGWAYGDGKYECPWVDFEHSLVELEDGMECHIIDIKTPSTIDFRRKYYNHDFRRRYGMSNHRDNDSFDN